MSRIGVGAARLNLLRRAVTGCGALRVDMRAV